MTTKKQQEQQTHSQMLEIYEHLLKTAQDLKLTFDRRLAEMDEKLDKVTTERDRLLTDFANADENIEQYTKLIPETKLKLEELGRSRLPRSPGQHKLTPQQKLAKMKERLKRGMKGLKQMEADELEAKKPPKKKLPSKDKKKSKRRR